VKIDRTKIADRVRIAFDEHFVASAELGASVCVMHRGEEVVQCAAGFADREKTRAWTKSTPVLVWSTSKGLASACLLEALQRTKTPLDTAVSEIWPDFGKNGKINITLAKLMSHQAGLAALDSPVDGTDREAVCAAICDQKPLWSSGHGYHPRTLGYIFDELLLRLVDCDVAEMWRRTFSGPLGLDAWFGVPEEKVINVAEMVPGRPDKASEDPALAAMRDTHSLTARAFVSPRGLSSVSIMNQPETLRMAFPSFGGVATAEALARFYAELLKKRYLREMTTRIVSGHDQVLLTETAFSAGFMMDPLGADGAKTRSIFGNGLRAFGHPGAGGSVAFVDPESGISFAYVMNQMSSGTLPNERARNLVRAVFE